MQRNNSFTRPSLNSFTNQYAKPATKPKHTTNDSDDDDYDTDERSEIGYHSIDQPPITELVTEMETDLGHLEEVDIPGINAEILDPSKFILRAIEQLKMFATENTVLHWPAAWLDTRGLQGRYVHPDILKERQELPELETLTDRPHCTWSDHERSLLMLEHEAKVVSNIDQFIENGGIEERYITLANDLEAKYQRECSHLPILWTVLNIRVPNSTPFIKHVFLNRNDTNTEFFEALTMLIQSRYFIEVAKYVLEGDKIELIKYGGLWKDAFTEDDLSTLPLVVIVPHTGDIFVFLDLANVHVISFYDRPESLEVGRLVTNALIAQCASWVQVRTHQFEIHGLVQDSIYEKYKHFQDRSVTTSLALEMMVHLLTDEDLVSLPKQEGMKALSDKLTAMCQKCLEMKLLKEKYLARRWWAITRGELGNQTDAMDRYSMNRKRGRDTIRKVTRSAWDFQTRINLSNIYDQYHHNPKNSKVNMVDEMLNLLKTFRGTDAITFSTNNIIQKKEIVDVLQKPMCDGITSTIFNARVDSMNRSYSDNGGPRLYTQKELDYMFTNVNPNATALRRKMTLRLFWGKPVFFLLDYQVSVEAMARNDDVVNHVALCQVYLPSSKKNNGRRVLKVKWLEGVFDNVYKLCAVPALLYLSMFFGVEVKQVEFTPRKTLTIRGELSTCVTAALFAANERMRTLSESNGERDWDSYNLPEIIAQDYTRELVYSLILIPRDSNDSLN